MENVVPGPVTTTEGVQAKANESASAQLPTVASRRSRPHRPRWARWSERAGESLIWICGVSAVLFVMGIFFFVFREGVGLLFSSRFSLWKFLFSTEWYPTSQSNVRYGVFALVVGTASVTGLGMLMAVPFGLGAAIFLAEFCNKRIKEPLKIVIELLAAIPSVVWGFIGISVMNPLIQTVFHVPVGLNVFNGALLLALMSIPIMVSIGEDALKAVPDSYREAAVAMGATKWQVVYRVLLPAGKNGLLAAILLGVGRAVGETMAVLMATGHAVNIPHSIFDPVRTLTATIAAELGETAAGSEHYQVLFIIGILLFSITFAINVAADIVVKGIRKA